MKRQAGRYHTRLVETLETRTLLSHSVIAHFPTAAAHTPARHAPLRHPPIEALVARPGFVISPANAPHTGAAAGISNPSPPADGVTPAQLRQEYGFNFAPPTGQTATGAGQTIAIVDAFHDPNIQSDLHTFDQQYLGGVDPTFSQVNLGTSTNTDPTGNWEFEESIDVEWAHAMAPQAAIVLVEAASGGMTDLLAGVDKAVSLGAQVVSMSWGLNSGETSTETSWDSHFTAANVTFVGCSGDNGAPGWYPAASPDVLGVGGTSVELDANNNVANEVGWSDGSNGSGGGISTYEARPPFQPTSYSNGTTTGIPLTNRGMPDVSYDADANNGIAVYDTFGGAGWSRAGGTSCGTPQWAAIIALADQLRTQSGQAALGTGSVLSTLYSNPQDFRDIVAGTSPGKPNYSAGPGYDLVTGLGSPMVPSVISSLVGPTGTAPATPPGLWAIPGDGQVSLTWDGSVGANAYNIYRSSDGVTYSLDATVTGTRFTDTGLTDGSSYSYEVTAANAAGESAAAVFASVVPQVPPAAPAQFTATASTTGASVGLQWKASPGAASYVVKRAKAAGGPWVVIAQGVSSTNFTDVDASYGHTYYYTVAAETAAGQESANSAVTSATVIPAAPTSLTATTSQSQVMLSWTGSVGATSYRVLRSTKSSGGYSIIASGVTATSFTDAGVTAGTTYYYVVQALDSTGPSAVSNQVSVTPRRGK